MLGVYGIGLIMFLMYFVGRMLWWLCSVCVHGFGPLFVVICLACRYIFVSTVSMERLGAAVDVADGF